MRRKFEIGLSVGVGTSIVILAVALSLVVATPTKDQEKSVIKEDEPKFTVDYEANTFTLNGEPFRYVAGAFHYFRAHQNTWRDKLRTMRAAGLNAVDLYVYWALHNPHESVYNFEGMADVAEFVKIAQEEDLWVILRPGPYICAEIDNGGQPHWLFTKYPNIDVRTSNSDYMYEVEEWFKVLMPKFEPYLLSNGGKIIMVQIENEYGIYEGPGACDKSYLEFLRDETRKYVDESVLLFSTDIPNATVSCGVIDNVYATIDFGADRGEQELADLENTFRSISPKGPLVNSEYYPGWLTHWQEENQVVDSDLVARVLRSMLEGGWNVNFYMFFGGTNFGFTAGANDWGIGSYKADITSYDYDAPMTEAGDPTIKMTKITNVIKDFLPLPSIEQPVVKPKMSLPSFTLDPINTILSTTGRQYLAQNAVNNERPLTFEELDQFSGFVLYERNLPDIHFDPTVLTVEKAHDRAWIYIDQQFIGILSRENNINQVALPRGRGKKLQILVENQGRINFNYLHDKKGILGDIYFTKYDGSLEYIKNWDSIGYPFEKYEGIEQLIQNTGSSRLEVGKKGVLHEGPVIFHKQFEIDGDVYDTYLNVEGWGKGHVWINGFNIGRYWPIVGPQVSMYVPADLLINGVNEIVIVEYQKAHPDFTVEFVNKAIWK